MNQEEFFKTLPGIVKNAVHITFHPAEQALPLGASKFGGKPHLPDGFDWFTFEGTDLEDITKVRPLTFLMQINMADVCAYDTDHRLPATGILYFFYDTATEPWGFNPGDKGSARVYWYDGDISALHEKALPEGSDPNALFPELALSFEASPSLPAIDEFEEWHGTYDYDAYEEDIVAAGYDMHEDGTKLLGYADVIQDDMLTECEIASGGMYCGEILDSKNRKLMAQIKARAGDWTLLLQLGSISSGNFTRGWGDEGSLFFYIKNEDLDRRDFSRIWMILQCC